MSAFSTFLLLLGCVALATARTVSWTGGAGNSLWSFASNWDSNAVPTKDDDVVINYLGGSSISVSQPAYARSIVIAGGNYAQTLTLLSSLSVGAGGLTIGNKGTLQLQSNNDLPLVATGNVVAQPGGTINFASGDITGPGSYTVSSGANIVFSSSALKKIEATDLSIKGVATIQPSSIELAKGATITNSGELTAIGAITIYSNDKSKASFTSSANFSYQGASANTPLTLQVATYLSGDFNIVSGAVIIREYFYSVGAVRIPSGVTVTVGSDATVKTFNNLVGTGSVVVQGTVEVKGALDVSTVSIADSGSLTVSGNGSRTVAKSLTIGGKLILNAFVDYYATDAALVAGTVTGGGKLSVAGNFNIAVSTVGNANSFISTLVNVSGNAYLTGFAYVLLADYGNLRINTGATLRVSATAHFAKQAGNPVVTNNGRITITLPAGNTFDSNVDFLGTGAFEVVSGAVTFDSTKFQANSLALGDGALLRFDTTLVTVGSVSGRGSLNVTAAPTPVSTFSDVVLSYFGVPNGNVQVKSVSVNTLELWSGSLAVAAASSNKASIFNFHGGILSGANAKVVSSSLSISGDVPQTIDGVTLIADKFSLVVVGTGETLIAKNGAKIEIAGGAF